MYKNLVIVESPAKAKTIEKFLGDDYLVTSCMGHIRDLQKKDFGIDLENNYQPQYIINNDKNFFYFIADNMQCFFYGFTIK